MIVQELIPLNTTKLLANHKKNSFQASIKSSGDEYLTTTVQSSNISIYSMESLQCVYSYSVPPSNPEFSCPCVYSDGLVFGCYDSKIHSWDITTNQAKSKAIGQNLKEIIPFGNLLCCVFEDKIEILERDFTVKKSITQSGILASYLEKSLYLVVNSESGVSLLEIDIKSGQLAVERELTTSIPESVTLDANAVYLIYPSSVKVIKKDSQLEIPLEKSKAFSIAPIDNAVAIISQVEAKTVIALWDTKYGSKQFEKCIYDGANQDSPDLKSIKSYSICKASSSVHGDVFAIATSSLEKKAKSFSVQFSILPFHTSPISLLSSLGKLSVVDHSYDPMTTEGLVHSVIPTRPPLKDEKKTYKSWKANVQKWDQADCKYLDKFLSEDDIDNFQTLFFEWVDAKHDLLQKWKTNDGAIIGAKIKYSTDPKKYVRHSASFQLSQITSLEIIKKCFSNPKKFWPRLVIEFMLWNGFVSSFMVPSGVFNALFEKRDYELIALSCEKLLDLTESDYVSILKYVLNEDGSAEELKILEEFDFGKDKTRKQVPHFCVDPSHDLPESKLNSIQKKFIEFCFSNPRSDQTMAQELKALDPSQILLIFDWIREIVNPTYDKFLVKDNSKFPLYWLWNDLPQNQDYRDSLTNEFNTWTKAIDAFGLLLDAHLLTIRLSPDLLQFVNELSPVIKQNVELLTAIEIKLKGPLYGTVSEARIAKAKAAAKSEKKKKSSEVYGTRFDTVVEQMELGVGEYAVEVFYV
ncbi:hypothetical protein HDV06_005401 [Boothiomyces sp. JEL0866]|nr:hypothetical protein HDV06_005401 [Boothiomyces sp. JEL0866]